MRFLSVFFDISLSYFSSLFVVISYGKKGNKNTTKIKMVKKISHKGLTSRNKSGKIEYDKKRNQEKE